MDGSVLEVVDDGEAIYATNAHPAMSQDDVIMTSCINKRCHALNSKYNAILDPWRIK